MARGVYHTAGRTSAGGAVPAGPAHLPTGPPVPVCSYFVGSRSDGVAFRALPWHRRRGQEGRMARTDLRALFEETPGPRVQRTRRHRLTDVVVLVPLGTVAGCQGGDDIRDFCREREAELREVPALPGRIPSADTLRRARTRTDELDRRALRGVRGRADRDRPKEHPRQRRGRQRRGRAPRRQRVGLPAPDGARSIVDKGAECIVGLKSSQPSLHTEVLEAFDAASRARLARDARSYERGVAPGPSPPET